MRIGELLIARGWAEPAQVARALVDQHASGERLCSLLIARGALDPDDAARALAEQHQVAAALERHLTGRDPALAALLPAMVARAHAALPLGRRGDGTLVVCVRDPRPALAAVLAGVLGAPPLLAVAAAGRLAPLIAAAYADPDADAEPDDAVEVDLSTQPIPVITDDELGELSLVDLDDHRVDRAPPPSAAGARPSLAEALAAIADAPDREAAVAAALRFARARWRSAEVVDVTGGSLDRLTGVTQVAPIFVDGRAGWSLVVGAPIGSDGGHAFELAQLAAALGE